MSSDTMERVVVTKAMLGICGMQVCAAKDATDEEILEVCNCENPAGTINGWGIVTRDDKEYPDNNPVQCADDSERLHFIVFC